MNIQRKAKMQFIRVIDRLAEIRRVSWKVVGNFVKDVISQDALESSQLEFMIFNKGTVTGTIDMVDDLLIMNFITYQSTNDLKVETKAQISVDGSLVEFDCIFYANYYPCVVASDQIILSSSGLSLMYFGGLQDSHNMNRGIALLQRLSDLKEKRDALIMMYNNIPHDHQIRAKNAMIMRRQSLAEHKGYTITGNVLLIDDKENMCPICYEKQCDNATLECTHKFCVECLATHMERVGDCYSKCPLCRQPLILKLVERS